MLATRRRRPAFPIKKFIKSFVTIAVIYELYSVPMSHKLIFEGPLKPFWKQVDGLSQKYVTPYAGPIVAPMIKPLHFAFQQRQLFERSHEITVLKDSVKKDDDSVKADEKKIADLQKKLDAAQAAKQNASSASDAGSAAAPGVAVTPSPDEIKTAAYWSAMEPENAASIAQKLSPTDTARVFLAMKPDQVAEIMDALPTVYNVKLKAVHLDGSTGP